MWNVARIRVNVSLLHNVKNGPVDKLFFSVSLSPLLFVSFTLVFGLKLERRLASVSG